MNCPHPDDKLIYQSAHSGNAHYDAHPARIWCGECKAMVARVSSWGEACQIRKDLYLAATGYSDIVWADMFGNPIEVGSRVVYPTMSGRSAQIAYGEVVEINPPTKSEPWGEPWPKRIDQPARLKIQPIQSSRWKQYYGRWNGTGFDTEIKPITLSANAPSAVVIS